MLEWQALLHEFIDKKGFEAILLGWGVGLDPDLYAIWHSSKTKEGEFNFISYQNVRVDALLLQGRRNMRSEGEKKNLLGSPSADRRRSAGCVSLLSDGPSDPPQAV